MATTIRLPNALLQNQAAVSTDFMDGGAWVNENRSPGMESSTSPIMMRKNWGICHRIEYCWSSIVAFTSVILFRSMASCRNPAQANDRAAHTPPMVTLFSGGISTRASANSGRTKFCQTGIKISSMIAPIAFACTKESPGHENVRGWDARQWRKILLDQLQSGNWARWCSAASLGKSNSNRFVQRAPSKLAAEWTISEADKRAAEQTRERNVSWRAN